MLESKVRTKGSHNFPFIKTAFSEVARTISAKIWMHNDFWHWKSCCSVCCRIDWICHTKRRIHVHNLTHFPGYIQPCIWEQIFFFLYHDTTAWSPKKSGVRSHHVCAWVIRCREAGADSVILNTSFISTYFTAHEIASFQTTCQLQ